MGSTPKNAVLLDHQYSHETINIPSEVILNEITDDSSLNNPPVKNQLGTFSGVFLPCILSIIAAPLYTRIPWVVGETGYFGVFAIFALAGATVILTTLSISAISTNGSMGGGGAYYMISRSLGPELGGSIGFIYYFANAVGTSFNLITLGESIVDTFWSGGGQWGMFLVASISLFFTFVAAFIGAEAFDRVNNIVIFGIIISLLASAISILFGNEFKCTEKYSQGVVGFTGPSSAVFYDNLYPNYTRVINDATGEYESGYYNFFTVFAIIFPVMTGILAGANLSGDLKNPGRSIGRGTLYAILTCIVLYLIVASLAAISIRASLLQTNYQVLQTIACFQGGKYLISLGIVCSSLSSALGLLFGGSRVLQALCSDFVNLQFESKLGITTKVFRILSYGSPKGNEPQHAVILTWLIAQGFLFLKSVNLLAEIVTNCFLLTFLFTNASCFILEITGAPNFRPKFQYFTWHTALLGSLLCLIVMFLASPLYAGVSIFIMIIACLVIFYIAPQVPWGDVSQAIIYHQVQKYLLQLDERKEHPKFWRPSVLLIIDDPLQCISLMDFCNSLRKGGLYMIGDVMVGNEQIHADACTKLQTLWNRYIPLSNMQAFAEVGLGETLRAARQALISCAGLGGMKPNTIVIRLPNNTPNLELVHSEEEQDKLNDIVALKKTMDATSNINEFSFKSTLLDAHYLHKNIIVAANFENLCKERIVAQCKKLMFDRQSRILLGIDRTVLSIDIWSTGKIDENDLNSFSGTLSLMLQLAHVVYRTDIWHRRTTLRLVHVLIESKKKRLEQSTVSFYLRKLTELIDNSRIEAEIEVLVMEYDDEIETCSYYSTLNTFIKNNTERTVVMFLNLPLNRIEQTNSDSFVEQLEELTNELPPVMLTLSGTKQKIITTEI